LSSDEAVVGVLDPVTTDDVSRPVILGSIVIRLQQIGRDLADVAEDLRRQLSPRIGSNRELFDAHTGEVLPVLLDDECLVLRHVLRHRYRLVRRDGFVFEIVSELLDGDFELA
jgi:hypothetical protein